MDGWGALAAPRRPYSGRCWGKIKQGENDGVRRSRRIQMGEICLRSVRVLGVVTSRRIDGVLRKTLLKILTRFRFDTKEYLFMWNISQESSP